MGWVRFDFCAVVESNAGLLLVCAESGSGRASDRVNASVRAGLLWVSAVSAFI